MFKNRTKSFYIGLALLITLCVATIATTLVGAIGVFAPVGEYELTSETVFNRDTTPEEEEYAEDSDTICPVGFTTPDGKYYATINYTYEEWEALGDADSATLLIYTEVGSDRYVVFASEPTAEELNSAVRDRYIEEQGTLFTVALSLAMLAISAAVMVFWGKHFTMYEKVWFLSILIVSAIVAVLIPEEDVNGVSGLLIMALYLADTFLNILCELLISKQSKWNFIVSVFVEIVEILVCLVLAYRFATMAVTLFFWLPCDIISFFNWNKKKDAENEEITKVRTLKGWQEILLIAGIVIWTVGIGTLLSELDIATELFGGNATLATIVCYLDACASAVGILNGLAILFRFREQWIAWYICSILEAAINILAGQYVLLVLKVGYLTNTTYGFIKWSKYIKAHPEASKEKTIF